MTTPDLSRLLLVNMLNVVADEEFSPLMNGVVGHPQEFLEHLRTSNHNAAREIVELMNHKADNRDVPLQRGIFQNRPDDRVLQELGSDYVRQILRLALAVNAYSRRDSRIGELFTATFGLSENGLSVSFVNAGQFLQFVLKDHCSRNNHFSRPGPEVPTSTPSCLHVLLFLHTLNFVSSLISKKRLTVRRTYKIGNTIGLAVQKITQCFKQLATIAGIDSLQTMVAPYIWYNRDERQFKVLAKKSDGFAPLAQTKTLFHNTKQPVSGPDGVDGIAFARSCEEDKAFRYMTYLLFDCLHTTCGNQLLYDQGVDRWEHMTQFSAQIDDENTGEIRNVFRVVPGYMWKAFGVERYSSAAATRTENSMDEDSNAALFQNTGLLYNNNISLGVKRKQRIHPKRQRRKLEVPTASENAGQLHREQEDISGPTKIDVEECAKTLEVAMRGTFDMYHAEIEDLIDQHELGVGASIEQRVQLVLCDPESTVHRHINKDTPNVVPDRLSGDYQRRLVDEIAKVLRPGGHAHVFCSTGNLSSYTEIVQSHKRDKESDENESVTSDDDAEKRTGMTEEIQTFEMGSSAVYYAKDERCSLQNPNSSSRNLGLRSIVEVAIHFWKAGLLRVDMLDMVQYDVSTRYIDSTYSGWVNIVDRVPLPSPEELVYFSDGDLRALLLPEQKSVQWMMDIVERMTKPGDIVVDFTAGSFSVMKACMQLPKHRQFVGCDADERCVEASRKSALLTFAQQVLNKDSDISGSAAVREAAKRFVDFAKSMEVQTCRNMWQAPQGLPHLQTMPDHIISFLSNYFQDTGLGGNSRFLPPDLWSSKWASRLRRADMKALLGVEAVAVGVRVERSTIKHRNAGLGLFATKHFGENELIGYYYGSLVYRSLSEEGDHCTKVYGEGPLAVSVERFNRLAIEIMDCHVEDECGKKHNVWIVPAPFCVAQYMNDGRVLGEQNDEDSVCEEEIGNTTEKESVLNRNNVTMMAPKVQDGRDLMSHRTLEYRASRNIRVGQELFFDYGTQYEFDQN